MISQDLRCVGITGLGAAVPERVLTNADLERLVDTSDDWIFTRTGIRQRRVVDPGTTNSDLAVAAGERALADAGVRSDEVDLIVVANVLGDMFTPATSNLVQARLGASSAAAFDLNAACPGFLYGLAVAEPLVATGRYHTVLVVGVEIPSNFINWDDRNTCVLFGDGAGAAVLQPVSDGRGILSTVLGSDGSAAHLIEVPAGGSRRPITPEVLQARENTVRMIGSEVFKMAVRVMGDAGLEALARAGLAKEDVSLLVPHQANGRIIEATFRRLELPAEKVMMNVDRFGNTSAASIPIALTEARDAGRLRADDVVLMVAFGAGMSWASVAMRWGR